MKGHDRLTAEGKRFFAEMAKLARMEIQAGYPAGGKGSSASYGPDEPTVAEVALWNEYGTYNIPSRPFLRQTVEKNEDTMKQMAAIQLQAIADGRQNAEGALKNTGLLMKGMIQDTITTGSFAPNAKITVEGGWMRSKKSGKVFYVKGKNSSHPLIDTGRLRQSVNFVVKSKGGD